VVHEEVSGHGLERLREFLRSLPNLGEVVGQSSELDFCVAVLAAVLVDVLHQLLVVPVLETGRLLDVLRAEHEWGVL